MFGIFKKIRFFLFGNTEPLEKHPIPQEVRKIEKELKNIVPSERREFLLREFFALHQRLLSKQIRFYYSVAEVSERHIGGTCDNRVTLITGHHSVVIAVWDDGRVFKTHNEDGSIDLKCGIWRSLVD